MATVTDVEVANQSFPNVRQDLNDILEALATNFSADAEPTTTYPNQFWYETDTNLLYIRNEANDAWVTLASINQTSGEWEPRTAVIQAVDSAGLALKTDEGTTRFSISDAGVVSFENYAFPSADGTNGQVLTTDGSGTLTFEDGGAGDKIEEGNSSVEVIDTGTGYVAVTVDGSETARFDANGRLGIGTTSPDTDLDISGSGDTRISVRNTDVGAVGTARTFVDLYGKNTGNEERLQATVASSPGVALSNGGCLVLYTNDSSQVSQERARIDEFGNFRFDSGFGSVATAYGCRAWVNFNGTGTVAIRDDGNVSSITDNGSGDYYVNFSSAMTDTNYSVVGSCSPDGSNRNTVTTEVNSSSRARVTSGTPHHSGSTSGITLDSDEISVAIFR